MCDSLLNIFSKSMTVIIIMPSTHLMAFCLCQLMTVQCFPCFPRTPSSWVQGMARWVPGTGLSSSKGYGWLSYTVNKVFFMVLREHAIRMPMQSSSSLGVSCVENFWKKLCFICLELGVVNKRREDHFVCKLCFLSKQCFTWIINL